WRGQVGASPVTEDELTKLAEPVRVAGQDAQLYEQAGTNPGSGDKTRILAAILRREGTTWFFKMTGDDEIVAQQKPSFIAFFKSYSLPGSRESAPDASQPELPPSHPPISGLDSAPAPASAGATSSPDKPQW